MGLPVTVAFGLLPVLAIAAWTDIRQRRVSNGLLVLGLVMLLSLSRWSVNWFEWTVLGGVVGVLVFLPFYLKGGMGAADIKLMTLAGLFLGPRAVVGCALYAALAGGVMALVALKTGVFGRRLPYALAIGLGVMGYLVGGLL